VKRSATCVVPPDTRPVTADAVSIGADGAQSPLRATVPTGTATCPRSGKR